MKKLSFKSISVKILALVLSLCACAGIYTLASNKSSVSAETVASFELVEKASIRDGEAAGDNYYGLRFETSVNTEWLTEKGAGAYSFGTLIFPAVKLDESKFDEEASVADNKLSTDAINFIAKNNESVAEGFTYYASIVYDRAEAARLIKSVYGIEITDIENDTRIDTVLNNLYAMEMAAVSYVQIGEEVTYTNVYTTSMLKVAIRLAGDETWGTVAENYIPGKVTLDDAYVSDEDDKLVIDGVSYNANDYSTVILGNDTLTASVDYTITDNVLVLSQDLVTANLGSYAGLYLLDADGNLLALDVLFADKVLTEAAEVIEAFDYGDFTFGASYAIHDKTYVLGNDIDMTGYTIKNRVESDKTITTYANTGTADAPNYTVDTVTEVGTIGFAGIFDGRGYAISNVAVNLINHSPSYTSSTGTTSWATNAAHGFFHDVLPGAEIRNVAFINVYDTGSVSSSYGLSGVLGDIFKGTIENVYVDIAPQTIITRGPFSDYTSSAVLKNVVVNFPRNYDYSIQAHLDSALKSDGTTRYATFAYGNGALAGRNSPISLTATYDNVFVASPMPVNFYTAWSSDASLCYSLANVNSITYGENELDSQMFYDFADDTLTGLTVGEALEEGCTKISILDGVRRYGDLTAMGSDTSATADLVATGLFKVADGQLIWHNQRVQKVISTAVDFDASEGALLTSVTEGLEVIKATVDGVNAEFTLNEGVLTFTNVPEKLYKGSVNQAMEFVIETADEVYTFNNVTYWTMVIDNAAEVKTALDFDYTGSDTHNRGFYKLANNIDMTGVTFNYNGFTSKVTNQNQTYGFAGYFDGFGHALRNANPGKFGLFGNFVTNNATGPGAAGNVTIKNLAITNFSSAADAASYGYGVVLGKYTNNHNYWPAQQLKLENLYVSYANDTQLGGLFSFSSYVLMNNVVVDTDGNTVAPGSELAGVEYGSAVAGKAIAFNDSQYTDGGSLFATTRMMTPNVADVSRINNVISFGKAPIIYQWGNSSNYENFWQYDSTNSVWVKKNSGTLQPYLTIEVYYGYAGKNQTKGDIPVMAGMKAGFEAICGTSTSAVAGYVCTTCGEEFSKSAGTCGTCGVDLTYFANLWHTPWSFVWELTDIASHVNTEENSTYKNGMYVFAGVSKYNTATEMANAYAADNTIYASFLGDDGNKMWKVSDTGVLLWHDDTVNHDCVLQPATCESPAKCTICGTTSGEALGHTWSEEIISGNDGTHYKVCLTDGSHKDVYTCVYDQEIANEDTLKEEGSIGKYPVYYKSCVCGHVSETETFAGTGNITIYDEMDFDATSGELFTSLLNGVTIDKVVIGETELTVDNGMTYDANADKYYLTGAPLVDNRTMTGPVITVTVYSGEFVYDFVGVNYWTMIINDANELKTALDIDYTVSTHNYGLYKLGNDISVTSAVAFTYNGASSSTYGGAWNGLTTKGFAGIFEGAGHVIDFKNTGVGSYGLFGALSNDLTSLYTNIAVRNFAILNYSKNWSAIIAKYAKYHNNDNSGNVIVENIYATWYNQAVQYGLIEEPNSCLTLRNVMVNTANNAQYGATVANPAVYGDAVGTNSLVLGGYAGGTIYYNLRRGSVTLGNSTDGVISIGKASIAKHTGNAATYTNWWSSTDNGDGTYTHTMKTKGWDDGNIGGEPEFGYASNREYGDIALITGMKTDFAEIASKVANSSTAIAGYYCANCLEGFSTEAGECKYCSTTLTQSTNLWLEEESYVWERTLLSTVNNADVGVKGEMVFANTYKYDTLADMKTANLQGVSVFDQFVNDESGCWTEYGDGMVMWHSLTYTHTCSGAPATCEEPSVCDVCGKQISAALGHNYEGGYTANDDGTHSAVCSRDPSHVETVACTYNRAVESEEYLASEATVGARATYYYSCDCGNKGTETFESANAELTFDTLVDYDASEGKLATSILGNATLDKVVIGSTELTLENGGLLYDEETGEWTIVPCDEAGTITVGVPFMNNKTTSSNVLAFTIYSGEFIYRFTNVHYQTMVINDGAELKAALDIDYTVSKYNYGFYSLGNNIEGITAFAYTGFTSAITSSNGGDAGFNGQFNGRGFTIDMKASSPGSYGLFGAFNNGGSTRPSGQLYVRDFAIVNFKNNGAPVLAKYTNSHNYWATANVIMQNIYVKHEKTALVGGGLIGNPWNYTMINVVVDFNDNTNYSYAGAEYGADVVAAKAVKVPTGSYYDGGSVFGDLRWATPDTITGAQSIVSIGKYPICYQDTATNANFYTNRILHTVQDDGSYVHTARHGGYSGDKVTGEQYIGYAAANRTKGDVPVLDSLKDSFASLVSDAVNGANKTLNGFACKTCYNYFALEAGTCPTCSVDLSDVGNLWDYVGCYNWRVCDLATYENPTNTSVNAEFKFTGIYKYDTLADMKSSGNTFDSFVGEDGNGMWAVVDGALTWVGNVA